MIVAFLIWCAVGMFFAALGVYAFFAQKPMGFWANIETFKVTDIKRYNAAVGKLFCVFGVVFVLQGLPLLAGQNSPLVLLSVVGVMFECIAAMGVYTGVIENKYRKK